jgi:Cu/Ag efflux protein CusF
VATGRFVTPDEDVTLFFHCHIEAHDKVGMIGRLIVGRGGEPNRPPQTAAPSVTSGTFRGVGVVVAAVPRAGRLIVNHEEIPGFMAAMEMSFSVASPSLLGGLKPGDRIQFTIDGAKSAITAIEVVQPAP